MADTYLGSGGAPDVDTFEQGALTHLDAMYNVATARGDMAPERTDAKK